MKLDVWRDPYRRHNQYQSGELVSSYEPQKRRKPVLKYGSGCDAGGPDCFNCQLPRCTWHEFWTDGDQTRNVIQEGA